MNQALKQSELQKIQVVQALITAKKNELALMEGGFTQLLQDIAKSYGLPAGVPLELKDGVLSVKGGENGAGTTDGNGQA